jgi:hypothetical protein
LKGVFKYLYDIGNCVGYVHPFDSTALTALTGYSSRIDYLAQWYMITWVLRISVEHADLNFLLKSIVEPFIREILHMDTIIVLGMRHVPNDLSVVIWGGLENRD